MSTRTPLRPVEDYFIEAIEEIRTNHRNYGKMRRVRLGEPPKVGFC